MSSKQKTRKSKLSFGQIISIILLVSLVISTLSYLIISLLM